MKKNKFLNVLLVLIIILFITIMLSLLFGGVSIKLKDVLIGLFGNDNSKYEIIMKQIRLPRIIAAIIAGVGLSISGLILQNITSNTLASPNIIGVNSGAGLFVILTLSCIPSIILLLPIISFVGAFLTTLLIILIANKVGKSKVTIILAGMVVTTLLNAVISLISLIDTDVLVSYNYFSIGGLNGVSYDNIILPGILIISVLLSTIFISKDLDVISLGDEVATSLGVNVSRTKIIALILASLSAACVVSFAGLLGFVGLMVPHIVRKLIGNNTRKSLIVSVLVGSILVLVADLLGRVVVAPSEVPVGIIMALVGAPFFLILLLKGGNHVRS